MLICFQRYLFLALLLTNSAGARIWTCTEGSEKEALYVSQGPEKVILRSAIDQGTFEVSIDSLSQRDRHYLKNRKYHTHKLGGLREVSAPEEHHFSMLQELALDGEPDVLAVLMVLRDKLYKGINYRKDRERVRKNGEIMNMFFTPLGQAAGVGNDRVLEVLIRATEHRPLRGFVAKACGKGAALGSRECLEVLLNHEQYNIFLSSAVFAMGDCAEQNNQDVINFLAKVLSDRSARALWHRASQSLQKSAQSGNETAIKALARYNLYQN